MALTDESGMVMPVGPMYGGGFGGGMGGFGGDWGWIILLLLCCNGGWGGFGGFGGMGGFAADGAMLYPWMNQSNQVNEGFRDQMLNDNVTSIRDGVTGISTQLCNGLNGVQMALANGFAGVEQGANTRQMADMQQMFSLQSQLAQCCCDNRLATCQTQNIVQSESAATRFADANNTRDIVESQTRNTQAILDKLCALELDGYKRENDNLRSQLNMATLRESQTAQNAFIAQGFSDEVDQLYNRLSNCPVPSTPVYGRTPIFTCNGNNGCGCGNF
jgi:hypothetical protein